MGIPAAMILIGVCRASSLQLPYSVALNFGQKKPALRNTQPPGEAVLAWYLSQIILPRAQQKDAGVTGQQNRRYPVRFSPQVNPLGRVTTFIDHPAQFVDLAYRCLKPAEALVLSTAFVRLNDSDHPVNAENIPDYVHKLFAKLRKNYSKRTQPPSSEIVTHRPVLLEQTHKGKELGLDYLTKVVLNRAGYDDTQIKRTLEGNSEPFQGIGSKQQKTKAVVARVLPQYSELPTHWSPDGSEAVRNARAAYAKLSPLSKVIFSVYLEP